MTAQISAYGRLVADPQTRTTTNGNNMAMARLAVSLPAMRQRRRVNLLAGRYCIGKQADALAKHQKGDL
jgi:single-stranded DNA-binding protein